MLFSNKSVAGGIEYERQNNRLVDLQPMMRQEAEYLNNLTQV